MEALLQSERQSSFDISICVMYMAKACMQCSIVFLMLSNTEKEENGNMNQWSHFPSHILPQAEMMSEFTRKTSLSGTNISEEEIQRKIISIKNWCWWFNRQHPYCKISNELILSVWCTAVIVGSLGFHKRGGGRTIPSSQTTKSWRVCKTGSLYFQVIQPPAEM